MGRRQLLEASEVFVTNSVHGVVSALALADGAAAWEAGPIARRLRGALASRPGSAPSPAARPVSQRHPGPTSRGRADSGRPAIVLVDNYDSFTYNLAHLLLRTGCQVEVVRNDEVSAGAICEFAPDGIVISPGPGTPAQAGISVDTVRACAATTPLLGICLGHQAIAAAYGARVTTAPQPVHGQKSSITHDGRGVLSGLPRRFHAARYHSLIIEENSLPTTLLISARGPGGMPMGLRHVQHPAEGLQFHPESILTTHGNQIIHNFAGIVRKARQRESDGDQMRAQDTSADTDRKRWPPSAGH